MSLLPYLHSVKEYPNATTSRRSPVIINEVYSKVNAVIHGKGKNTRNFPQRTKQLLLELLASMTFAFQGRVIFIIIIINLVYMPQKYKPTKSS